MGGKIFANGCWLSCSSIIFVLVAWFKFFDALAPLVLGSFAELESSRALSVRRT